MQILKITKAQLDADNQYTGPEFDSEAAFEGHVEIDVNLGYVKFKASLRVIGRLTALAGSGIKAGEGIEAGWGIEAGEGIEAGWGIKAGEGTILVVRRDSVAQRAVVASTAV